jgi:DNA ligase-1
MADLEDGESVEVQGSGSNRYTLKNVGGVFSCSCPAWRNAGGAIETRSCKHLRAYRGEAAELERTGAKGSTPRERPARAAKASEGEPPLLLAHAWDGSQDPTGWWMSEKLDGVRAYWDGKRFVSRLGNEYLAPDWFVDGLPDTPLDGELWGGRKRFQRTVGLVKRQDRGEHWRELVYVVFDAPAMDAPFEERLETCRATLAKRELEFARPHDHEPCRSVEHLRAELARVESLGGEGLMLRKPGSRYQVGRSSTLLKVKSFQDAEARVVEHLPGAGKHAGRTGALLVETPEGKRFSVGTGLSDREREDPPPIGEIITYRYQELSEGGVPRFPSYVGVRADAAWTGTTGTGKTMSMRRLEMEDDVGTRFWEVSLDGASYSVRSGVGDGDGETKKKTFAKPELAKAEVDRLIARKLDEGWGEVESAAPAPKKSSKPAAAKPAPKPAPAAAKPASAPVAGARHFEFVEGTSSKFWEISVNGAEHTVRFGRIGTNGQTKTKSFPDAASAARDAAKLVEEKVGKGYVEKTGAAARDEEE